ncbi:MAG: M23 family metallopeptidase [Bacteroidota bacterium]
MTKQRYYYNPNTCNYELIKKSPKDVVFDLLGFFTVAFILAAGFLWGYTSHFDSPKEMLLRQENALLQSHFEQLKQKVKDSQKALVHLHENDNKLYRLLLNAEPIPVTILRAGVEGADRYLDLRTQHTLIAETTEKVDTLKRQLRIQSKSYAEVLRLAKNKEKRLAYTPAVMPIPPNYLKRISDHFGPRMHPVYKIRVMHHGIDFSARSGTPVIATANGTVVKAKFNRRAGNYILIDHGKFQTKYCHLKSIDVKPYQKVIRGQRIGTVGNTGTSTAPHLHYEVLRRERRRKKRVDPADYFCNDLNAKEYAALLKLAARKTAPTS